ncbi:MAG: nucleoside-diphosphate kinase [Candidatus Vogelbacteria bacterium]|nr:nucleoside-diphosphate kinase [Candidatus Vogelbacteria bacterium]
MLEHTLIETLVLIKPDAVAAGNFLRIIDYYRTHGLEVVEVRCLVMSRPLAENFYAAHRHQTFYGSLIEFMTSGLVIALRLVSASGVEDSISRVRFLNGATDPSQADESTIRGRYGTTLPCNAVHGSESYDDARRELALIF